MIDDIEVEAFPLDGLTRDGIAVDGPTIEGEARNGSRVKVTIGEFETMAGFRERGGGAEVAYIGKPPAKLPAEATVDGRAATVTRGMSRNPAMVVLDVAFDQASR